MSDDTHNDDLNPGDLEDRSRRGTPIHLLMSAAFAVIGASCLALAWAISGNPNPTPPATPVLEAAEIVAVPNAFPDIPIRKVKVLPIHLPGAKIPLATRESRQEP